MVKIEDLALCQWVLRKMFKVAIGVEETNDVTKTNTNIN